MRLSSATIPGPPKKKKKKKHDAYSLGHESQKSPRITKENGFKNQNDPEKFLAS
jgi:hypothetical protein